MTKDEKELVVIGCYLRCKLDKRGFHGYLSTGEVSKHLAFEKQRISKELIPHMKRFVKLFENLN